MEVSNKVRVKDEPICEDQSSSDNREEARSSNSINQPKNFTNKDQSIKHERDLEFIPISDSKRTRDDIWSDDRPNNRKRQSMKVKEEPIDIVVKDEKEEKLSTTEEFANKISIAFLNEETNTNQPTTSNNEPNNPTNKKSK